MFLLTRAVTTGGGSRGATDGGGSGGAGSGDDPKWYQDSFQSWS